jgi:hypothetical protein
MLKPEIPAEQIEAIRPVLEPLLARLRTQVEQLPPQSDSALVYSVVADEHEAGQ